MTGSRHQPKGFSAADWKTVLCDMAAPNDISPWHEHLRAWLDTRWSFMFPCLARLRRVFLRNKSDATSRPVACRHLQVRRSVNRSVIRLDGLDPPSILVVTRCFHPDNNSRSVLRSLRSSRLFRVQLPARSLSLCPSRPTAAPDVVVPSQHETKQQI